MPLITFVQAVTTVTSLVCGIGCGSIVTAFVSARKNKGDYFLTGFKQLIESHQVATSQATAAANTCAEKLAQRDSTIADRDRTIRDLTAERDKTLSALRDETARLRDEHEAQERDWWHQLRTAEEECAGHKRRLIEAGLLTREPVLPLEAVP